MRPTTRTVLAALQRGERISINDSRRLRCGAITQRISELRALGITINDYHPVVEGKRQAWKMYFMDVPPVRQPRTETVVAAHVRRLLRDEPVDEQPGLFA